MQARVPQVGIIMGSQSDWPTMRHAAEILTALDIIFEARIVRPTGFSSMPRTPSRADSRSSSQVPAGQRTCPG